MFKINNNDFIILSKYKVFLNELDNLLENIPRKDMYYKDKLRETSLNLLEEILLCNYAIENIVNYEANIKSKIALIDFLIERFFYKKYISEKASYKIGIKLVEINKMTSVWLSRIKENDS